MVRWCGVGRGCLSVVCALSCVFFLVLEHQQMAHRSSLTTSALQSSPPTATCFNDLRYAGSRTCLTAWRWPRDEARATCFRSQCRGPCELLLPPFFL